MTSPLSRAPNTGLREPVTPTGPYDSGQSRPMHDMTNQTRRGTRHARASRPVALLPWRHSAPVGIAHRLVIGASSDAVAHCGPAGMLARDDRNQPQQANERARHSRNENDCKNKINNSSVQARGDQENRVCWLSHLFKHVEHTRNPPNHEARASSDAPLFCCRRARRGVI